MLRASAGKSQADGNFDVNQMASGMKAFVGKVSSHEGAEFPG